MYKPVDENTLVTCNISCNSLGTLMGVIIANGVETEAMEEVIRQSGIQMQKQSSFVKKLRILKDTEYQL